MVTGVSPVVARAGTLPLGSDGNWFSEPILSTACRREVELVTATQAAGILQVGEHELERFAGAGGIHLVQTVSGRHWVCKNSLFRNEERL